jgi:hypothetical protein
MRYWRQVLVAALGAASLVGVTAVGASAHEGGGGTLIEFESMTGVGSPPATVRGIPGGGKPWVLKSGRGEVDRNGNVEVRVRGLVIPVAPFNGTNPVPFFKATVSCVTPSGVVNVSTANFPADSAGNSRIEGHVALPSQCADPIVFVAAPTGQWFAESNSEHDD